MARRRSKFRSVFAPRRDQETRRFEGYHDDLVQPSRTAAYEDIGDEAETADFVEWEESPFGSEGQFEARRVTAEEWPLEPAGQEADPTDWDEEETTGDAEGDYASQPSFTGSYSDLDEREARILSAMAKATYAEQTKLMADLNDIRQVRAARIAQDRELDLANAVIRDTMTPVPVHGRVTSSTDWLDEVPVYTDADTDITVMAAEWVGRVDDDVKADRPEFVMQAKAMARRTVAGAGAKAEAAFVRAALDLAYPKAKTSRKTAVKPGDTVTVDGYSGIAFYVDGYEKVYEPYQYYEYGEDGEEYLVDDPYEGEWVEPESGRLRMHMIGDDREFVFDEDEVTPVSEGDFCWGCGQTGCTWHTGSKTASRKTASYIGDLEEALGRNYGGSYVLKDYADWLWEVMEENFVDPDVAVQAAVEGVWDWLVQDMTTEEAAYWLAAVEPSEMTNIISHVQSASSGPGFDAAGDPSHPSRFSSRKTAEEVPDNPSPSEDPEVFDTFQPFVAPENADAYAEKDGVEQPLPGAGESTATRKTAARPIHHIYDEIVRDWKNPNYAAVPYLDAMRYLGDMSDSFYSDSAPMVVGYFLSNAGSWRGETARRVKAELRAMIDEYYGKTSSKKTAVSLTNVGIEGDVGVGTTSNGQRVKFKLSDEDREALKSVLYSDLAVNFTGVDVDESDIIERVGARRKTSTERPGDDSGTQETSAEDWGEDNIDVDPAEMPGYEEAPSFNGDGPGPGDIVGGEPYSGPRPVSTRRRSPNALTRRRQSAAESEADQEQSGEGVGEAPTVEVADAPEVWPGEDEAFDMIDAPGMVSDQALEPNQARRRRGGRRPFARRRNARSNPDISIEKMLPVSEPGMVQWKAWVNKRSGTQDAWTVIGVFPSHQEAQEAAERESENWLRNWTGKRRVAIGNEGMTATQFALDAILPLLRPDTYAVPQNVGGEYWIFTPSTGTKAVLFFATRDAVEREFATIGTPVEGDDGVIRITDVRDPDYYENIARYSRRRRQATNPGDIPNRSEYEHWNEEADQVWYQENKYDMMYDGEPGSEPWDDPEWDPYEARRKGGRRPFVRSSRRRHASDDPYADYEERLKEWEEGLAEYDDPYEAMYSYNYGPPPRHPDAPGPGDIVAGAPYVGRRRKQAAGNNLMPADLARQIPKLYETEDVPLDEKMIYAKYFHPMSGYTMFVSEYDGDDLLFGFVTLSGDLNDPFAEWGYSSLSELNSIEVMGLGVERDEWFTPTKFGDLQRTGRRKGRRHASDIPSVSDYAHWNEEAERVWYQENKYDMYYGDESSYYDERDEGYEDYGDYDEKYEEALAEIEETLKSMGYNVTPEAARWVYDTLDGMEPGMMTAKEWRLAIEMMPAGLVTKARRHAATDETADAEQSGEGTGEAEDVSVEDAPEEWPGEDEEFTEEESGMVSSEARLRNFRNRVHAGLGR